MIAEGDGGLVPVWGDWRPATVVQGGRTVYRPLEDSRRTARGVWTGTYNDSASLSVPGLGGQLESTGRNLFDVGAYWVAASPGNYSAGADGSVVLGQGDGRGWSTILAQGCAPYVQPGRYTVTVDMARVTPGCKAWLEAKYGSGQTAANAASLQVFEGVNVVTVTVLTAGYLGVKIYDNAYVHATSLGTVRSIQVEAGADSTAWEPYTAGLPSPSPDWPQPIESRRSVTVTTCGKNLADPASQKLGQTVGGVSLSLGADGGLHASGTNGAMAFSQDNPQPGGEHFHLEAGTWTVSAYGWQTSGFTGYHAIGFCYREGGSDEFVQVEVAPWATAKWVVLSEAAEAWYWIAYPPGTWDENLLVQLERGTVPTAYEPYAETSVSRTFDPPLRLAYGVGDEWSLGRDGTTETVRRLAVYDGSFGTGWQAIAKTNGTFFYGPVPGMGYVGWGGWPKGKCTHLRRFGDNGMTSNAADALDLAVWGQYGPNPELRIFMPRRYGVATLEQLRRWWSDNGVELRYATQDEAVEAGGAAEPPATRYPTTHLWTGDGTEVGAALLVQDPHQYGQIGAAVMDALGDII